MQFLKDCFDCLGELREAAASLPDEHREMMQKKLDAAEIVFKLELSDISRIERGLRTLAVDLQSGHIHQRDAQILPEVADRVLVILDSQDTNQSCQQDQPSGPS